MKIKYSVKKILDFKDAKDGDYIAIMNGKNNTCSTIFKLRNPYVRADGVLIWDNGERGWDKKADNIKY